MTIKQGNRADAIKALINTWLKFPMKSCATCGVDYMPGEPMCCEAPVICTNQVALEYFFKDLREVRETRLNCYGSNKDKTMRLGVSIPAGLYTFLDMSMNKMYGQKLFDDKHNTVWFAKNFPQFQVPERM